MKLNLDQVCVDLDGKPLIHNGSNLTFGKAFAEVLISSKSDDKLRSYTLAQLLNKGGEEIELNESDIQFLRETVKRNENWATLVLGQLELFLTKIQT